MSKYTHTHIVSLESKFKPGTLGNEVEYYRDPPIDDKNMEDLFVQEDTRTEAPIRDLDIFHAFVDPEEPDPEEVLRQAGMYDSTDPRSCIRRKRK